MKSSPLWPKVARVLVWALVVSALLAAVLFGWEARFYVFAVFILFFAYRRRSRQARG